jgi:co-chaperonin GroES (HSP10)
MIKPLGDNVLLKKEQVEETLINGIYLKENENKIIV